MRARSCLRHLGGALLLAAPLALSLPGVEASRADPAPARPGASAAAVEQGGVCRVEDPALPRRNAEALAVLQRRLQAQIAAEPGEAVVLDGRGYGYHPPQNVAHELELLREEAAARSPRR